MYTTRHVKGFHIFLSKCQLFKKTSHFWRLWRLVLTTTTNAAWCRRVIKFAGVNMNMWVKISVNRRLILPGYDHLYVTPRGDKFPSSGCQHQRLMTVLEGRDIK